MHKQMRKAFRVVGGPWLDDKEFNDYLFHVMINATREQINKMGPTDIKKFKDHNTMHEFCNKETFEKKLWMLLKLQITFCIVCAPMKNLEVLDDYFVELDNKTRGKKKRVEMIKAMQQENLFVYGDKYFMMQLEVAAQNSHSDLYNLNQKYTRIGDHFDRLEKDKREKYQSTSVAKAIKGVDQLAGLMTKTIAILQDSAVITGLEPEDLKILITMLPYRYGFISTEKMAQQMSMGKFSYGLPRRCNALEKGGYISREPGRGKSGHGTANFSITSKGIKAVMDFMNFVIADNGI